MRFYFKTCMVVLIVVSSLLAVEIFVLPEVTPDLKKEAEEFFTNECKGCHRWARKFAAPPMKENVSQYAKKPEEMVKYLMHPSSKNPDLWPPMEITPLNEKQAKMMTAWLFYILENENDPGRPK